MKNRKAVNNSADIFLLADPRHFLIEKKLDAKYLEVCVERFLVENVDLNGWEIVEIPFEDEKAVIIVLNDLGKELTLTFRVLKKTKYNEIIAIPVKSIDCCDVSQNTISNAIVSFDTWYTENGMEKSSR